MKGNFTIWRGLPNSDESALDNCLLSPYVSAALFLEM